MKKTPHKFTEKMEETYEQLFLIRYHDIVQLAREFERAVGKEETFKIIGDLFDRMGVEMVKKMTEKEPINTFEDFTASYKDALCSPLFSHALTAVVEEETPKKLKLCVTECLWAETFRKMNAQDLGYVISCQPDFSMARAFHENIRMERTKTLMQNDDCCNHTYYWEE